MNPHAVQSISPIAALAGLWRNRDLMIAMVKREVVGRYKGSILGIFWSFLNPVLMLTIYTFVFSVVFKSRWGIDTNQPKTQFAIILFVGLIVHGLFSEVINRAPSLITSNVNFVKRVLFPLDILPAVALGAALFHSLISLAVLLLAFVILSGFLHWTIIFIPFVLAPLVILVLGIAWILSSLGVFLRDIGQVIGLITMIMLFLSPIFYPVTALPAKLRPLIMINPLSFIIEQAREVIIWGHPPDWLGLCIYSLAALIVAWLGFAWFQKTRKGFADVL